MTKKILRFFSSANQVMSKCEKFLKNAVWFFLGILGFLKLILWALKDFSL